MAFEESTDAEGPSGAPPELIREANADLIARLVRGILPYLILLLVIGATTDYRTTHPLIFLSFTIAIVTSIGMRVALSRLAERVHRISEHGVSRRRRIALRSRRTGSRERPVVLRL